MVWSRRFVFGFGVAAIAGFATVVESPTIVAAFVGALILVLVSGLMQAAVGVFDVRKLTIPGLWYLTYVALIVGPSYVTFASHPGPHRGTFMLAVWTTLVAVPFGVGLASLVLRFDRVEVARYFEEPVHTAQRPAVLGSFLVCLAFCLALTGLYLRDAESVPLFQLMQRRGDVVTLALLREESLKVLESPLRFLYNLLREFFYPVLIMIALGTYLSTRRGAWLLLFVLTLAAGFVYASLTLARFPPAAVMLQVLLFLHVYRSGRLSTGLVLALAAGFLAFPLTVMILSELEPQLGSILARLGYRLVLDPAFTLYHYFEVVPEHLDYLGGRSFGRLTVLTGQEYFNLENYVARYMAPLSPITTGTANAAFPGSLYANFGMMGVVLGGILTGFVMQLSQICLVREGRKPLYTAVYSYVAFTFFTFHFLPITTLVFSGLPALGVAFVVSRALVTRAPEVSRRARLRLSEG